MATKSAEKRSAKSKSPAAAQQQYAPTGGKVDVNRLLDVIRYGGYWLVGLVLIPALALLFRALTAGSTLTRVLVDFVVLIITAVLVIVVWDESSPRGNRYDRLRVCASVIYLGTALVGTGLFGGPGPVAVRPAWAWVLWGLGFVLALWWTIGALPAVAGRGHDAHAQQADTLAEQLGLGSSHITSAEHSDDGVRSAFKFRLKGVSVDALRSSLPLLASRMQVPGTGLRVEENPDDAGNPTLVVVREDVLRHMGDWPGPSNPGGSITEPVRSGRREDGSDVLSVRYNRHKLVGGATGAGKTEGAIGEWADGMTRRDVCAFWSDTVKPGQTIPDIAPTIERVATTKAATEKLVNGLLGAIEYRAGIVGSRMWVPTPKLPAVYVHFEEARLVANYLGDKLVDFVSTARSVGIFITMSFQRPSGTALDTDARAQFGDRECYGVMKDDDTDMILTEGVIEAGAVPHKWGDKRPGYHYREAGEERLHAMPARTWLIPVGRLRRHVAEWAPRMARLDAGTAQAMGTAWTELKSGRDYALEHGWLIDKAGAWLPPFGGTNQDEQDGQAAPSPAANQDGTQDRPRDEVPAWGTPAVPVEQDGIDVSGTSEQDETSDHEQDNDEGDELTMAEREEITREGEQVRAEMLEALGPIDPEIADALAAAEVDADTELPTDLADGGFTLWTGDGEPLDYRGRVGALADELQRRFAAASDKAGHPVEALDVTATELAEALTEVPGWYTGHAPAVYRLLEKAVDAGQAEDRGHGRPWQVEKTCPGWLRREVAHLQATEGDDEPGEQG